MDTIILNIQRFCVHDGPGIRTTIFLKGCLLDCLWCHNPESKSFNPILAFHKNKCLYCKECSSVRSNHLFIEDKHYINRDNCSLCNKCVEICNGSLEIYGEKMSVNDVLLEVLKDKEFYLNSKGGVTLSGGEPLLHIQFIKELLIRLKENNIHVCIETSGYVKWENIEIIIPYVDIFLYDIKESNDLLHKKYTGKSNKLILDNLYKLNEYNVDIILRCPIILGYNYRIDHFEFIAKLANKLKNVIQIDIEPYHSLGKSKCEEIGVDYPLKNVKSLKEEEINYCINYISKLTNKKIIKS